MKFGKVDDLSHVRWGLPPDDAASVARLARASTGLDLFFGAPAWGHPVWEGKVYPEGAKRVDFLLHYARYFNCVELNTTHYRIPNKAQLNIWKSQVGDEFLFCPKIYQGISHERRGLLSRGLRAQWFDFLRDLVPHLGPSFLQLPPHFDYSMKSELFTFLQAWPADFELALEFRHPSWFQDGQILPALAEYLDEKGISAVITDVAGRRDVLHSTITGGFVMLRFVGNNLHASDFTRADQWCERIASWQGLGLQKLFLFIHEPDDISVPEMTEYFLRRLSAAGVLVREPTGPAPPPQLQLHLE